MSNPFFDWDAVRKFFEQLSRCLAEAEKKWYNRIGFSPDRYTVVDSGDRRFVVVTDEVFEWILTNDLPEATRKYPDSFGTGDPEDVLRALFNVRSGYNSHTYEEYKKTIFTEKFCWMVEVDKESGLPVGPLLRVDLSRGVNANGFLGGVFHAFKHFALDGVSLSHSKDNNEISSPLAVINLLLEGFFFGERTQHNNPNDFVSFMDYGSKYKLKFVFYQQDTCGVFFVTTIVKQRR